MIARVAGKTRATSNALPPAFADPPLMARSYCPTMNDTTSAPVAVREFMTGNLCTVDGELSITDAMQRMEMNRIRHLAVTKDGAVIGMVSNRDLGIAAGMPGVDSDKTPVSVAITGEAHTVDASSPLDEVAAIMEAKRFGSVVVAENGEPIGIFTTVDALRALRQYVTGEPAERLSPPTHDPSHQTGDAQHDSRASARQGLRSHGAAPSPNDGKFGKGPI